MSTRRDERGAVALIMAAVMVTLCLVAAFVVDFGLAYNSKRDLQAASDAGALAAVQVYKGRAGACPTLRDDVVLRSQAQAAADTWAEANRAGKTGGTIAVTCAGDTLTVTYGAAGATATTFGGLADITRIETSREASASIGNRVVAAGGLRPWGICANAVTRSGEVVFVPMEGASTSTQTAAGLCGSEGPPGGWWVAQCTGQGNANGETENAVLHGCPSTSYTAVPGQPSPSTPTSLYDHLTGACPSGSQTSSCLSSDTGNNFHNSSEEWQTLVGKRFAMPVFCTTPDCSSMAVAGNGANASYAIYKMATVELCGFEFSPRAPSTGWPTTGLCETSNPRRYESDDVVSGGGLFLVVTAISGGPTPPWRLTEYQSMRLTK